MKSKQNVTKRLLYLAKKHPWVLILSIIFLLLLFTIGQTAGVYRETSSSSMEGYENKTDSVIMQTPFRELGIYSSFQSAHTSEGISPTSALPVLKCLENGVRFIDLELIYAIEPIRGTYAVFIGNNNCHDYLDWSNVRGTLLFKDVVNTIVTFLHSENKITNSQPLFIHLRLKPTIAVENMNAFYDAVYRVLTTQTETTQTSFQQHLVHPDELQQQTKLANLRPIDLIKNNKFTHLILDTSSPIPMDMNIDDNTKSRYKHDFEESNLKNLCAFLSAYYDDPNLSNKDPDIQIFPYLKLKKSAEKHNKKNKRKRKKSASDGLPSSTLVLSLPYPGFYGSLNNNILYTAKTFNVQCCSLMHFIHDEALQLAQKSFKDNNSGIVLLETFRNSSLAKHETIPGKITVTLLALYIAVGLFLSIICFISIINVANEYISKP